MMSLGGEAIASIVEQNASLAEIELLEERCKIARKIQMERMNKAFIPFMMELGKQVPSIEVSINEELRICYSFRTDPCPLDREYHEHYIHVDDEYCEVGNSFDAGKCRFVINLDGTNSRCGRDGCHQFDEILNNKGLMAELRLLITVIRPAIGAKYLELSETRL